MQPRKKRGSDIAAAVAGISVVAALGYAKWLRHKLFLPGMWDKHWSYDVETFLWLATAFVCSASLAVYLLTRRAWLALLALAGVWVGAHHVPISTKDDRIRAELPLMKANPAYGKHIMMEFDGRKLRFYRWFAEGIDNAWGIVHDPERRLKVGAISDDGPVPIVEEIEPGWYFVRTT